MSIIHSTSKPESTLTKKCHTIAYHVVWKSVAIGESLTGQIRLEDNPADLLTKVVTGEKRKYAMSLVLCDIFDGNT